MLERLNSPLSASIEVTNNCNLDCIHCYNDKSSNIEMNAEHFVKIVRLLERINVFFVKISGGEPLCHKTFVHICQILENSNLTVGLVTNGFYVNKYCDIINKTFDKVDISIDGNEEVHNLIRGRNCFRTIINNVHLIKIKKIACATLSKINYKHVETIVNIAKRHGFDGVSLYMFKPVGRGLQNKKSLLVDEHIFEFIADITAILSCKYNIKINYVNPLTQICHAGKQLISISPNGSLKPCAYSMVVIGNVIKDDWDILWKKCQEFQNTCHAFQYQKPFSLT